MNRNLLLVAGVVLLAVIPMLLYQFGYLPTATGEPFTGADGQAEQVIGSLAPHYRPWFSPVWEPPSGEIESLLFALQAALGSGFIGYYVGHARGRAMCLAEGRAGSTGEVWDGVAYRQSRPR